MVYALGPAIILILCLLISIPPAMIPNYYDDTGYGIVFVFSALDLDREVPFQSLVLDQQRELRHTPPADRYVHQ